MSEVVAVYGGSFDPPHVGHSLVAAYVLSAFAVDRLLVVPAANHPFGKSLSPYDDRMQMSALAMRHLVGVEVSDLESRVDAGGRTLPMLQKLQRERPAARLHLVVGSDLVEQLPRWHEPEAIQRLAKLLVVQRQDHRTEADAPAIPAIGSTELRERLRKGLPVDGLLAPAVQRYIAQRGLYGVTACRT